MIPPAAGAAVTGKEVHCLTCLRRTFQELNMGNNFSMEKGMPLAEILENWSTKKT